MKSYQYTQPTQLHLGSFAALADWLEKYANALNISANIDYWVAHKAPSMRSLADMRTFRNAPVYVTHGGEAYSINVAIHFEEFGVVPLCRAKFFGRIEQAWQIAGQLYEAMFEIFGYNREPMIVEMNDKIPRKSGRAYESPLLDGPVIVSQTDQEVKVLWGSKVLDHRVFLLDGGVFAAKAYADDWGMLLGAHDVEHHRSSSKFVVDERVPGYIISDRAVPECPGLYVLPPNGDPLDDRDYLGYFPNPEAAIAAALEHQSKVAAST